MKYKQKVTELFTSLNKVIDEFVDATNEEGAAKQESIENLRQVAARAKAGVKGDIKQRKIAQRHLDRVIEFHVAQNVFLARMESFVSKSAGNFNDSNKILIDYMESGLVATEDISNLAREIDPSIDLIIEKIEDEEEIRA